VPGLGKGDVLNAPDFTVTALHAYHLDFGLTADQPLRRRRRGR
jgi:hypothetical protein